jgi:hypothetical protein
MAIAGVWMSHDWLGIVLVIAFLIQSGIMWLMRRMLK